MFDPGNTSVNDSQNAEVTDIVPQINYDTDYNITEISEENVRADEAYDN